MKAVKIRHPKTHSDILWHFTGGPKWNQRQQKQSTKLKTQAKAFEAFIKILKSRTLRVGSYHELIKCTVSKDRIYNKKTKRFETQKNIVRTVKTAPVCCVADIPLTELFHHAKRYGKMAIGFKRDSLIKEGFNPVFYTLHTAQIIENFYQAQNILQESDLGIADVISDIENSVSNIECDHSSESNNPWEPDENFSTHSIEVDTSSLDNLESEISSHFEEALSDLEKTLAFIKTFDRTEFDTIYSEREWRSVKDFKFNWKDISALILPKQNGYFKKFTDNNRKSMQLPAKIKIHQWEEISK